MAKLAGRHHQHEALQNQLLLTQVDSLVVFILVRTVVLRVLNGVREIDEMGIMITSTTSLERRMFMAVPPVDTYMVSSTCL